MPHNVHISLVSIRRAAALLVCAWAALAEAQQADRVPPALQGVGITQKLNAQLPLDAEFVDENGDTVHLRDYFKGDRPVVLTLNYYKCPGLCTYQLNGLVQTLQEMDWTPGRQFEIVTVSFDPLEDAPLALNKKQAYMEEYGREGAAAGWHFLTGRKDAIKSLTETVGFAYRWNEEVSQWAHDATLVLCTPSGRVSRYLGGIMYDPKVLRLSLVEASDGKIGSLWDSIFLNCFHYDVSTGKYTATVMGIVRVAGVMTLFCLAGLITTLSLRERNRRRAALAAGELNVPTNSCEVTRC